MHKIASVLVTTVLCTLVVTAPSPTPFASPAPDNQYEVLSPWAEADAVPRRGLSPRLDTLAGKKIGLFVNAKLAGIPIAESIDRRLKAMYPDVQTIVFRSVGANVNEIETKNKERFTAWAKGLDAAIAVVGD